MNKATEGKFVVARGSAPKLQAPPIPPQPSHPGRHAQREGVGVGGGAGGRKKRRGEGKRGRRD